MRSLSKATSPRSRRSWPTTSRTGWSGSRPTRSCWSPATTTSRSNSRAYRTGFVATTSRTPGVELFGLRIWGSPWHPWFYDWAFNAPRRDAEEFLASKFDAIPGDTDVVVAHGPPRGFGDRTGG